MWAPNRTDC